MPTQLQIELTTGPLAAELAPLVAADDAAGIVAILNGPRYPTITGLYRNDFAAYAASTGLRAAISDHASNAASPLRSVALGLLDFLAASDNRWLGLSGAGSQAMLQAWVAAGAITAAQRDAINALATQSIGRAQIVFGRLVTEHDVVTALRDDGGNKLI